jgi:hypothetical protein
MSKPVRISERSQKILKELAASEGKTMQEILDDLLEERRRKKILEAANAAYAALRSDPVAWEEELKERAAWDNTLMDGIEEDEQWNEDGSVKNVRSKSKSKRNLAGGTGYKASGKRS